MVGLKLHDGDILISIIYIIILEISGDGHV